MVVVPGGVFRMGCLADCGERLSPKAHEDWLNKSLPVRQVSVASFAISKHEVTFADWNECLLGGGCDDSYPFDFEWGRSDRPVINVSWIEAQAYIRWLGQKTGRDYRLPSEAEWEYAARAGTQTRYHYGNDKALLCRYANLSDESCPDGFERKTAPVGSFLANEWGLHDMHGNVWEWLQDCVNESYMKAPLNDKAWTTGNCRGRVIRGGSWNNPPGWLRVAVRNWQDPRWRDSDIGFRVASSVPRGPRPGDPVGFVVEPLVSQEIVE